jgi:hypothetical protein
MAKYGILRSDENTGNDGDLIATFIAPLSIISNKPTYSNETVTLKRRSIYTDIQRWEISTGLAPLADATELLVHNTINGYTETFYARMPQLYRKGTISERLVPRVFNDVAQNESDIFVKDIGVNKLPVGEFIRFSGHSKIYMIKESVAVSGQLNKITVFPKLTKPVDLDETIFFGSKVTIPVKYGDDTKIGITYVDGILAQVDSITLIEAL